MLSVSASVSNFSLKGPYYACFRSVFVQMSRKQHISLSVYSLPAKTLGISLLLKRMLSDSKQEVKRGKDGLLSLETQIIVIKRQ